MSVLLTVLCGVQYHEIDDIYIYIYIYIYI